MGIEKTDRKGFPCTSIFLCDLFGERVLNLLLQLGEGQLDSMFPEGLEARDILALVVARHYGTTDDASVEVRSYIEHPVVDDLVVFGCFVDRLSLAFDNVSC